MQALRRTRDGDSQDDDQGRIGGSNVVLSCVRQGLADPRAVSSRSSSVERESATVLASLGMIVAEPRPPTGWVERNRCLAICDCAGFKTQRMVITGFTE